jgi:methylthioribose-1-phosphate isomerase
MSIITLSWVNNKIKIIDQTKLPGRLKYIYIKRIDDLWMAIKELKVRGAPALGAAGALGVYLGVKDSRALNFLKFKVELDEVSRYLGSCRPTAHNLFWGIERVNAVALRNRDKPIAKIKLSLLKEALRIIEEDKLSCRRIGNYGDNIIRNNDTILTICNAGILATIDYGTALGIIYHARESGRNFKVYACETRPLLQGSRLTAWELKKRGIDVTIICDNTAASLMASRKISKVITGADRIALNGDTANKIGTYNLAVLSKYHGIPFYIAAPISTFDPQIKSESEIKIEERSGDEVRNILNKKRVAPCGCKVFNPAFDVTENNLITAFITDCGIIRQPFKMNISKLLC